MRKDERILWEGLFHFPNGPSREGREGYAHGDIVPSQSNKGERGTPAWLMARPLRSRFAGGDNAP